MGPAVWAEVGEGMAASTAAEVMPSARTGGRPISRLRVLRAYPRCDQKTAIQFIDHTLAKPPFAVERVQTDIQAWWCPEDPRIVRPAV